MNTPEYSIDDRSYLHPDVMDPAKPLLGKECATCNSILEHGHFQKDASIRDGYSHLCNFCAAAPKLSIEEHSKRLYEQNLSSEHAKRIRGEDPESWMNSEARYGKRMHVSEFLSKLTRIGPQILIAPGLVSETGKVDDADLLLLRVWPDGVKYESIGFCPRGWLPEFSIYRFGKLGERIDEAQRGWRTVLLRAIMVGAISEEDADKAFGKPTGEASHQWRKQLYNHRNGK